MRTDIAYVNALGERVEFGGSEDGLHYFEHGLRDWSWSYTVGTAGAVTGFSRRPSKPREVSFPVGIAAHDGESGIALRNRVEQMGEVDIALRSPGRLYVGDWYVRAYVVACEPTDYWMDDRIAELDLTVLVEDPSWLRETVRTFVPETGDEQSGGTDFPFDFPFEFLRERASRTVYNGSLFPQDFLWRAYGPIDDPWIRIGGNLYQVHVDVPSGSMLEVDSIARSVRVVGPDGTSTQAYGYREPGAEGSGSYILERIPVGTSTIAWPNTFTFDLAVYEARTSCPWEVC